MELSTEQLQELKCIHCEKYLACGPIYIRDTSGEAICGQCTAYEDKPVTRNKQYEIVARKLVFPCVHRKNGCNNKIPYSEEKFNLHEYNCTYRDRICPVSKSGECEWIGPWTTLVEHCRAAHPNNVFDNPCTLKHDITTESLNAYLVSAFNLLFMLHVKVSVTEAKIYYSLRYLGNPRKARDFKYKLDVQRNEIMLSKPGQVAPEGILTIQMDSCLTLCVNSLLSFLGEYEGTTFTVTLQRVDKTPVPLVPIVTPKIETTTSTPTTTTKPVKCLRAINGCHYTETEKKIQMHERYFCMYIPTCFLCNKGIIIGQIHQHYLDAHQSVTYLLGNKFRVNQGTKKIDYCLISSTLGKLICWYSLNEEHFEINIITPLATHELNKYRCAINITNTKSKRDQTLLLTPSTNSISDWSLQTTRASVPSKKFDLIVLLNEI